MSSSRQVEQLVRLVDDLLDISRITGGKIQLRKEPIDVAAAVTRAVETSRPLIDARKHELIVSLPAEPLSGERRPGAARPGPVKPAEQRGQVHGGRREDRAGSRREVDDEAVFRVRDNGIGISAEMLSRVFDLFTQADRSLDRSQGGLGIGLTLVRRLVEMHGGSVQAFSEGTNRGVRVRHPPARPGRGRSRGRAMKTTPTGNRKTIIPRRILIVDDHPDVTRSLARLLRLSGHEVRTALDGPTALDELAVSGPRSSCSISDCPEWMVMKWPNRSGSSRTWAPWS